MTKKDYTSTPDPLASYEVKKTDEYGVQVGKFISAQWFSDNGLIGSGCQFLNRRDYVRNKRLLVRGENDPQYYKDAAVTDALTLQFMNLDFSNINWFHKYARTVSNGISDRNYRFEVRATDKLAALQTKERVAFYKKYMRGKTLIENAKKHLNIDMSPEEFIPEDDEEMEMLMDAKDRPKIEEMEEVLVEYVLNSNDWENLSQQYNKDITDVGLMICRIHIDKQNGVVPSYVDPENYIHSIVKNNDFSDKTYEGVVDTLSIADVKREWPQVTNEILRNIAQINAPDAYTKSHYTTCDISEILAGRINVLRFAYKSSKEIVYKEHLRKGETTKLTKKDAKFKEDFNPDKAKDFGMVSQTFGCWFEGTYILGTEYIYDYKECENLYDDIMNKAMSPFVTRAYDIYENRLKSFTDNIEAPARQLQKITIKIQHLVSELTPDMKEIDIDALANLEPGKGGDKKGSWELALALMSAKGVVFKKRINMGDDGLKDASAVRPAAQTQGTALTALLNVFAHYLNIIRENTGINPARDGTMSASSLVGVNQMAELASNTVTADIVEAAVGFKQKICETISTRLHNIWNYDTTGNLKKIYEQVVGIKMLGDLEVLKNRHLHEFGFMFVMNSTTEEINEFKRTLEICITRENLDPEIVTQANEIAKVNLKKAIRYLMYKRRRINKEVAEQRAMEAKMKSEFDAQASQQAAKNKLDLYQGQKEIELKYIAKETELLAQRAMMLNDANKPKDERDFEQDVYIEKMKSMVKLDQETFSEDRKDGRTKIQATQQSKMIEQRKKEGDTIDFESEDNWFMNPQEAQ